MRFIDQIAIKNFKCYRDEKTFLLNDSTFLVGANNSGKSAVLVAFLCFFDEHLFEERYINRTEFRAKQKGYNTSEISLKFNVDAIDFPTTKERIKKTYGKEIRLKKSFIFKEVSGIVDIEYEVNGSPVEKLDIDKDIQKILDSLNYSYIHPQQAENLLTQAQTKLKERLFARFGRHHSLADALETLEDSWQKLRKIANDSLSKSLTSSLQDIWPGCDTKIDLPENIEDIVRISDISFRATKNLPAIELRDQGTGAQSTILYQIHNILDSDRTLHKGMYFPVWLIEEPESFLHVDLIIQLGNLLNSNKWLDNIQIIGTSHNGNILSTSRQNSERINLVVLSDAAIVTQKKVSEYEQDEMKHIGALFGDPYFDVIFNSLNNEKTIMIEDSRHETILAFKENGIAVSQALNGSNEVRRYIEVLLGINYEFPNDVIFIVDQDDGFKSLKGLVEGKKKIATKAYGFQKFHVGKGIYLLVLPDRCAVENLYEEFDSHLEECANSLFGEGYTHAITTNIPANLSRAHAKIRRATNDGGLSGAKRLIEKEQDIKDTFWVKVRNKNYQMESAMLQELKETLE